MTEGSSPIPHEALRIMGDPPPRPHELLPPLFACLPTAFVSPRPPPALLSLLTPILKQRVQLLSASSPGSDGWLPLLCWDAERASRLGGVIERLQIEPHPVSGEIEIGEPSRILYRRLDSETLQSRFELDEFDLVSIYLWCLGDGQDNEKGWKLAELRSLEDLEDGTSWYGSISEANEEYGPARASQTNGNHLQAANGVRKDSPQEAHKGGDEDDDDAYWAAYDRTPGRTPSIPKSSPPPAASSVQIPSNAQLASELKYFARYMSEVQPALDPEDPDEEALHPRESTLNGNTLLADRSIQHEPAESSNLGPQGYDSSFPVQAAIPNSGSAQADEIHSPSPTSRRSGTPVEALEQRARSVSSAEFGIKQHISTDIKSLYRLAKSAGIDRDEFERIVRTELDVLSFMDQESPKSR